MVVGLGIDIVQIARFSRQQSPELFQELFLPAEIAACTGRPGSISDFAARFAAKEAAFKALSAGLEQGLRFRHVEVVGPARGTAGLVFHGPAAERATRLNVTHSFVSLSQTHDQATAMVVLESRAPGSEDEP